jgi:hypothetical protein
VESEVEISEKIRQMPFRWCIEVVFKQMQTLHLANFPMHFLRAFGVVRGHQNATIILMM